MKSKADVLARLDTIIEQGNAAAASAKQSTQTSMYTMGVPTHPRMAYVEVGLLAGFRTAGLSFLKSVFGESHPHYREFEGTCRNQDPSETWKGLHILKAARGEIDCGFLDDVRELLRAEVFADFLEMAEHLLDQGYKDPAAVMIGSVLEEHLRQLAARNGIALTFEKDGKQVPKKADTLNAELAKAEVYNKLDQKAVTAWLDLRNNAAHGKYDEYTKEQVKLMLDGVLDFVRRVSIK